MQEFTIHTGIVAPLHRANIDTDQIIPKQFLKRIERTGFGQFLFYDWRYKSDGSLDSDFVLNKDVYQGASILVAGKNFGCGSSREHAPWALADYGFRAIIAPSFADIFANNCVKNGILTVIVGDSVVAELAERAVAEAPYSLTIDLSRCVMSDKSGWAVGFSIDPFKRKCLLQGLDDIALTLAYEREIAAFEARCPGRLR